MIDPRTVVVIGMGELGRIFAEGLGRLAAVVIPVTRQDDVTLLAATTPSPDLVLMTVGESELPGVTATLPGGWKQRIGLVQNELRPPAWRALGIENPTVAVVWFEKKPGRPITLLRPTVVAGPARVLVSEALRAMNVDVRVTDPGDPLTFELAAKNVYILTTNCAGLQTGGTVGELFSTHRPLALAVAEEILDVEEALAGQPLDREGLLADLEAAVAADKEHACRGRTAADRLARVRAQARAHGLKTPTLDGLAAFQAS